jgi:hypothetical protein
VPGGVGSGTGEERSPHAIATGTKTSARLTIQPPMCASKNATIESASSFSTRSLVPENE